MGIMIRQNRIIRCIHIQKEYCLFQYADDTIMFLDGTEKSLKAALDLLFQFSKYSGLKPNFGKTKAIWIGSKSGSSEILCPNFKIQWTNEDFNVLGIKFNSSLTNITEINFEPKLTSIIKEINNWNKRQLTPLGKITVIKHFYYPN